VSTLRARCPDCRTLTAVALGPEYQCHSCGREFGAGLVRVPRAWGQGGEAMAEAAALELPYPEAAIIARDTLDEQSEALAASLPERPLVLGGCCCAHIGAIRGLAQRVERLGVVWFDAHGDLNTRESSPSGNEWGMPLRMAIGEGSVSAVDVALVGARSLDPPELAFMESEGIDDDVGRVLNGAFAVYVALDVDVLRPGEVPCFVPEEGGPTAPELVVQLHAIARAGVPLAGLGITGLAPGAEPARVARFARALGL
jgi:arginase family enzyme